MEITFLTEEEIWNDKWNYNALEIMQTYGKKVEVSDTAIALGTYSFKDEDNAGFTTGIAWSASSVSNEILRTVSWTGVEDNCNPNERGAAGRPVIPATVTPAIRPNKVKTLTLPNGKTVQICEYGAYPQTVAPKSVSQELEARYQKNALKTTGKTYTFDSAELDAYNTGFTPRNCAEYSFAGKKYVRIEGKPYDNDSILSDGTQVQKGQAYWFEVQPIEWLMDPKGTWVARQALFAGIQFDTKDRYDGNFADTAMYNYLQTHFAKEMEAQRQFEETLSRLAIRNRYFSAYVSGFGNNKEFYPNGDRPGFTPAAVPPRLPNSGTSATPTVGSISGASSNRASGTPVSGAFQSPVTPNTPVSGAPKAPVMPDAPVSGTPNAPVVPAVPLSGPFTPEKARAIIAVTNDKIFMRDLLKLIAAFPKDEQGQFKSVVLEVFNPERDSRPQPAEVIVLGKKLAVSGGYEKELNRVLQGQGDNGNSAVSSFASRLGKLFGGR